jgi:hypothetical protein
MAYEQLATLCPVGTDRRACCPLCAPRRKPIHRKERDLHVWHREPGFASYHCHHCGAQGSARDRISNTRYRASIDPARYAEQRAKQEAAAQREEKRKYERAIAIWQRSIPLPDTLGWRYFTEHRDLHIGALRDLRHALRWHRGEHAVIALMTDPIANKPSGIHRTFLKPDGGNVKRPDGKNHRLTLGHLGVIRLSPDNEVTYGLGICEGVEDALRILLDPWAPIWCACSDMGIAKFPVLAGVEALTIFQDEDEAGKPAADACAETWTAAGREVRIPSVKDFEK